MHYALETQFTASDSNEPIKMVRKNADMLDVHLAISNMVSAYCDGIVKSFRVRAISNSGHFMEAETR